MEFGSNFFHVWKGDPEIEEEEEEEEEPIVAPSKVAASYIPPAPSHNWALSDVSEMKVKLFRLLHVIHIA